MKTNSDPRHLKRIRLLQALYSLQFAGAIHAKLEPQDNLILSEIQAHLPEINHRIDEYATKFSTEKMAKIDLAVLQLGIYELVINNKEPYKVILDESIELAKEFGAVKSASFVNGILGKLVEELKHEH